MSSRSICNILCDLVPFAQFKKRENTHGRVLLLVKLQDFRLQLYYKYHSFMGVFQVFKIVQMVANRAAHHIYQNLLR